MFLKKDLELHDIAYIIRILSNILGCNLMAFIEFQKPEPHKDLVNENFRGHKST